MTTPRSNVALPAHLLEVVLFPHRTIGEILCLSHGDMNLVGDVIMAQFLTRTPNPVLA